MCAACAVVDTVKCSDRYLQLVMTALHKCVDLLCMTLSSIMILTVGHDIITKCVSVCVSV